MTSAKKSVPMDDPKKSFGHIDRPRRLSDEIADRIKARIVSGDLAQGDRIPTEAKLVAQFGVSRSVVREAIAKLRQIGLVTTRQGVGAFVGNGAATVFQVDTETMRTIEDLRAVMELRMEMEVSGAAMAARRRTGRQLSKLAEALAAISNGVHLGADTLAAERRFHRLVTEATNNPHFRDFMQFLSARINASLAVERSRTPRGRTTAAQVLREYEAMFEAIGLGDPDEARRATWYHLLRGAQRLGLRGLLGWEESRMTLISERRIPTCAGAAPNPRPPRFPVPADACDCHAHVFGPVSRYPYVPQRTYTPPDAPLSAYRRMLDTLGIDRGILVQPSVYGTDNRATLDALAAAGANFRGVVVVDEDVPHGELERMHAIGVRGVRLNLLFKSGIEVSDVRRLASRIAPFGWHLQMLIDVSEFSDLRATLGALPVEVVIDHMGHMPTSIGVDHPGFQDMLALLADGRCWVKLSGAYRITCAEDLPYDDVTPYARALVQANPDRLLWASDWPHPYINVAMPNDGSLLDLLDTWVGDADVRDRILVDNPAALYGFDEA